jgi:GntR family transcriptional regulator, phosphonate transport system regulatory protein
VIESVNVDRDGVPIQWAQSHFCADRVRLTVGG